MFSQPDFNQESRKHGEHFTRRKRNGTREKSGKKGNSKNNWFLFGPASTTTPVSCYPQKTTGFYIPCERKRRRIIEEEPGTATLQTSVVSKQTVQTARIVFPLYAYYFRATSQRDTLLFIFSLDLNEAAVSATALQQHSIH